MNCKTLFLGFVFSLVVWVNPVSAQLYITNEGTATFTSDAPLELISATSDQLSGAIDVSDNRFAFRIANKSFIGFNSALQQEHFYENYIETDKYKYSSFQGKIIEKIDLSNPEPQQVRAKGTLSIHGVEQERIVKATLVVEDGKMVVFCEFTVPLEDHDIRIPNVVYQKIAEVIDVEVNAELNLKTD
jgi:hypothetical protein